MYSFRVKKKKKGRCLLTEMGSDLNVEISITSEEGAVFLLEIYLSGADRSFFFFFKEGNSNSKQLSIKRFYFHLP